MPRIFDNMKLTLASALQDNLGEARSVDICVGYFNLRGWRYLDSQIEHFSGGEGSCCRLIVGMQRSPQEELRRSLSLLKNSERLSNKEVNRLIRVATEEFREQLQIGAPTNADEAGLRRLSAQLRSRKLLVRLYLREPLHAKLYLIHRDDHNLPAVSFVGSSNLTPAGLKYQGELNVDVLDHDATTKLANWFEDCWQDRWGVDVTEKLADIIDDSWARELMADYRDNSIIRVRQDSEFQECRPSLSKLIIDEIDRVLAEHYGFTDEKLDFIINYDIKYRMGAEVAD